MSKYIKVTPKGETQPRIVLATLKPFFVSHGAKVETPTDEEVYALEPALRPKTASVVVIPSKPAAQSAETSRVKALNAELEKTIDGLRKEVAERDQTIKEQAETIESLREKVQAGETALAETEAALEAARKELAKSSKKDKGEEGAK